MNVWERKQVPLCKLNFKVWSFFNLFSPCPSNFGLVAALHLAKLARLLMNQVVMSI